MVIAKGIRGMKISQIDIPLACLVRSIINPSLK
jgi:hypothetical protein